MTAPAARSGYTSFNANLTPARARRRLCARVVDGAIVALCSIPVFAVAFFVLSTRGYGSDSELDATLGALGLLALGYAVYEYRCMTRTGQTVGKRLLGIRVVALDGAPLSSTVARNRVLTLAGLNLTSFALIIASASAVTSVLAPVVLVIVFEAALLWRADGRHLADRAAGTIVVADDPELGARAFRLRRVAAVLFVLATLGQGVADLVADTDRSTLSALDEARTSQFLDDIATIYGAADALAGVDGYDLSRANFEQYLDEAITELGIEESFYSFDTDTNELSWSADADTTFVQYLCFTGPLDEPCPTALDA
jgi:uncharacterized RDD family membrane protein YckC